ncbi:MAG: beta-propeller fold lactonase family protein [Oligoflexales bacterium]|nr:beta-propeller fold lactonase family protein [Oligoflexales bacterium]
MFLQLKIRIVKLIIFLSAFCFSTACLISQKQQFRNPQQTSTQPTVKKTLPPPIKAPTPIIKYSKKGDFIVIANQESESLDLWYRKVEAEGLTLLQRIEQSGKVGPMVFNPENNLLYVGRIDHYIDSYYLDKNNKTLALQKSTFINHEPTYLELDSKGKNLFIVTYFDNVLINYRLGNAGELFELSQKISTKDKPHSIFFHSNLNTLYIPTTGSDRIQVFNWNAAESKIIEPAQDIETNINSGPRHIVKHPVMPLFYVSNEYSNSVSTFVLNEQNGKLETLSTSSSLPANFSAINTVSDIHITPNGRLLFVGNRGHHSIGVFKINSSGIPEILAHVPTEAKPRDFHLDNNNEYLYVAGQDSGFMSQYKIHSNGIKFVKKHAVGKQPVWVEVIPL